MPNDVTAMGLNSSECMVANGENDYLTEVYTITFPATVTLWTVDILICDDSVLEENEIFSLTIVANSHPNNVINGSPDHVNVTIVDNDSKSCLLASRMVIAKNYNIINVHYKLDIVLSYVKTVI